MNSKDKGKEKDHEHEHRGGQEQRRGDAQSSSRRNSNATSIFRMDDRSRPEMQARAHPGTSGHPLTVAHGSTPQAQAQAPLQARLAPRSDPMSLSSIVNSTRNLSLGGTPAYAEPTNLPRQQSGWVQRPERFYEPPSQEVLARHREDQERLMQQNLASWERDVDAHTTSGSQATSNARSSQSGKEHRALPMREGYQVPTEAQINEHEKRAEEKRAQRQNEEESSIAAASRAKKQIGQGPDSHLAPPNLPSQSHEGSQAEQKDKERQGRRDITTICLHCRRLRITASCDKQKPCGNCSYYGKRCAYEEKGKKTRRCLDCSYLSSAICTGEEGCERCENLGIECDYSYLEKAKKKEGMLKL